jgi:hypothetical protein
MPSYLSTGKGVGLTINPYPCGFEFLSSLKLMDEIYYLGVSFHVL